MANYIIIKNVLENSVNYGKIKKIELTTTGIAMFKEIHSLMQLAVPDVIIDRKKHKLAIVTIFKNGARLSNVFEYTHQNKKIDFKAVEVEPVNDSTCPHCGSDEIDYDGDRSFGDGEANQEVNCPVCDCHWINVYKFNGVQILN